MITHCTDNGMKTPWVRLYFKGLVIGLAGYAALLVGSILLLEHVDLGIWQVPVGLMPVVPLAYMVWTYMRSLKLMDEFMRHIHVRSILFAAGVTVVASAAVAFFGNAGLPPLTFHVWPIMCVSWGLALAYNTIRYK